jgi:simple sugar transport system substrate-binding protein
MAAAGAVGARFPQPHPRWRFVFVNHALTNPFFVPAKNGSRDAAGLIDASVEWTGSVSSDVGEMVRAMRRAVSKGADGIAVSIIDPVAFDNPTALALEHGIPVVAYNADGGKANKRLAYIGQDNYQSGLELGARVAALVRTGDVYLFIATPRQQNIQPRIDGALDAIRDSGLPIRAHVVASGVDVATEVKRIETTYREHKGLRGLFAVDAGSTAGVAHVMRKHRLHARGVKAGGYDLLPTTLRAIHDGHMDFTIDQQPYLQGFQPVVQLFLHRYSSGLVVPADTNTGLNFLTRRNVARYLTTQTRFEGSSTRDKFPVG